MPGKRPELIRGPSELEVLLPMLAMDTLPLFLRLDGVPGVKRLILLPGVAGVRPPLEFRELLIPTGVFGEGPLPPLVLRTNRPLEGVPGVLGVLAGVPGTRLAPGVTGVVLPPLPLPPSSMSMCQ
jgi:hypothetical protein